MRFNPGWVAARVSLLAARCAAIAGLLLVSAPAVTRPHPAHGASVRRDGQAGVLPARTSNEPGDRRIGAQNYDLAITTFPDQTGSGASRALQDSRRRAGGRVGAIVALQPSFGLVAAHSRPSRPGAVYSGSASEWAGLYAFAQRRPSMKIFGQRIIVSRVTITPSRATIVLVSPF
jgi:hypothetical protein